MPGSLRPAAFLLLSLGATVAHADAFETEAHREAALYASKLLRSHSPTIDIGDRAAAVQAGIKLYRSRTEEVRWSRGDLEALRAAVRVFDTLSEHVADIEARASNSVTIEPSPADGSPPPQDTGEDGPTPGDGEEVPAERPSEPVPDPAPEEADPAPEVPAPEEPAPEEPAPEEPAPEEPTPEPENDGEAGADGGAEAEAADPPEDGEEADSTADDGESESPAAEEPALGAGTGHERAPSFVGNSVASINDIANGPMKDRRAAFAFSVDRVVTVQSHLMWWRYKQPGQPGNYASGDGGTYRVSIVRDDGSGRLASDELAHYVEAIDTPNRPLTLDNMYRELRFDVEPVLEPGHYFLVIENVASDPNRNYVSFNGTVFWDLDGDEPPAIDADPARPRQRVYREEPDGRLVLFPERTIARFNYSPFWALRLSDGTTIGNDIQYGEYATEMPTIGADRRLRQRFTITDAGASGLEALNVLLSHQAGSAPLDVLIDGVRVASLVDIPLVAAPDALQDHGSDHYRWYRVSLPETLEPGREYLIEFAAPAGPPDAYRVNLGIRNLSRMNAGGYRAQTEVSENGGEGWRLLRSRQGSPLSNGTMALYLSE